MNLTKTTLGTFNLYTIETGRFRLDGGAMFGVVPKTLWSRQLQADDKNRIPMAMRCLLIESTQTDRLYLIDNGAGSKFNDKMESIYDISYEKGTLHDSLAHHGFDAADVTDIIFTHLHFDHCGGTTFYNEDGHIAHTFVNARYHLTKRQWKNATEPNAREKASYLPDNIDPLKETNRLHLVDDHHTYEEGLSALPVHGHSRGQQLPLITDGNTTILFAADLIPTHVHLPLPWVMGYDMHPTDTLTEKEKLLKKAATNNWYLYLEHDAHKEMITVAYDQQKFSVGDTFTLSDL